MESGERKGPRFVDVYLSNQFDPCPCGHHYEPDDIVGLRDHFNKGHYAKWRPKTKDGEDYDADLSA